MIPEVIKNIFIVGSGSFIGGAARYIIMLSTKSVGKEWLTLSVNLLGCLAIGLIWGFLSKIQSESGNWALFLIIGVCGGFTTFSTFSKDALIMLQNGNILGLSVYICVSVIAGLLLTALGYYIAVRIGI
ncbi:MAG: CrcB family protein [Bacteroidia bacterium]|nr:CrcB family protein [Bacteroidia bacterium]